MRWTWIGLTACLLSVSCGWTVAQAPPDTSQPPTVPTAPSAPAPGTAFAASDFPAPVLPDGLPDTDPTPIVSAADTGVTPQDAPPKPPPPEEKVEKPELRIYGFAMMDMIYDSKQVDPAWFDVVRPTKLPAVPNEFGPNGNFFGSVRQTRFGTESLIPTPIGQLKAVFEWELFGVGIDAGQTTLRLRHAYVERGQFLAGQTWSPFMDPDVFPNSVEYWGPNGMVFFRNIQFRWQPVNNGNHQIWIAAERPGASADLGAVQNFYILQGTTFHFPAPDITGRVRYGGKRTYLQVSGALRYIAWFDNAPTPAKNLTGHTWGSGISVSTNIGVSKQDTFKGEVVYGRGIENYMNDATVDVAPRIRVGDTFRPIEGEPLPILGVVAFYDHYWGERWSTSTGFSMVNLSNSPLQLPDSFHLGYYALGDLFFYPVDNLQVGGEFIWGQRHNLSNGFVANDYRVQFSVKGSFSYKVFGGKQ